MQLIALIPNLIQVRIPENNDWVIFSILGCIFAFLFMLLSLNREANLKEFIMQEMGDSSNALLNWLISSLVFCILLSVFISQYVPIVPEKISHLQYAGLQLNKFGFTFITLSSFYLIKMFFTILFYSSIGDEKKWIDLRFIATKLYFLGSLSLATLCIAHYYFITDKTRALAFYFSGMAITFIFKILFYSFNKNNILPEQWFYKILYICTLQILPLLVLWKVLFL